MSLKIIGGTDHTKLLVVITTENQNDRSFLIHKLLRYMGWLTIKCKNFKIYENERVSDMEKGITGWFAEDVNNRVAILNDARIGIEQVKQLTIDLKSEGIDTLLLQYKRANEVKDDEYETIAKENALAHVRVSKQSNEIFINKVQTYLQTRVIFYILNINMDGKSIYLSRHGESVYNVEEKIGGDSSLSARGLKYAQRLPSLIADELGVAAPLTVWTSTLRRTQETAQFLPYEKKAWKALDELDAGICDGLTYKEIEERYPNDYKARDNDKYQYRYRGGESYADVVNRIEPIIMELERQENILIITHQAVLRCIYAYFMNIPQSDSPWMTIPLHTLIKLTTTSEGVKVTKISTDIPAVSTYKEKGCSDISYAPSKASSKFANALSEVSNEQKF